MPCWPLSQGMGEPYCLVAMLCGREREKEVWKAKRCEIDSRLIAQPPSPLGVGRGPMKDYDGQNFRYDSIRRITSDLERWL